MRVLLDTHTLVWAVMQPATLPARVQTLLEDTQTQIYASSVSLFEMSIKHHLGKWQEVEEFVDEKTSDNLLRGLGALLLPVYANHARLAGAFSSLHKDPFDRLLAAQAICENLVLLSKDPQMDTFSVQRIWD